MKKLHNKKQVKEYYRNLYLNDETTFNNIETLYYFANGNYFTFELSLKEFQEIIKEIKKENA